MKVEELKERPFAGRVDVAQLLKDAVGSKRSYRIDEIVDVQHEDLMQGEVILTRTSQGILVQSQLTLQVELVCSRCLTAFLYPLAFTIEEECLPTSYAAQSPEEAASAIISSDGTLDLGETIRQYALLSLPMKPLCKPDCSR
ncbi:MAG: DUF177 domain-containing protein [Dehalococcoidia bacterium]|nr:DUF177 domain-containing protein [Dehalococcoidia bacterium]